MKCPTPAGPRERERERESERERVDSFDADAICLFWFALVHGPTTVPTSTRTDDGAHIDLAVLAVPTSPLLI